MIPETVQRAQAGDEQAFAALFHEHRGRVHATCLRLVHDPSLADDLVQETFLRVFRMLPTFRGDAQFKTWLYRVAWNTALMSLRAVRLRENRAAMVSLEVDSEGDYATHTHDVARRDGSLELVPEKLTMEKAIENLPPGMRAIFRVHIVEGFTNREAAAILGTSIGNIKSQASKAKTKLRKALRRGRKLARPTL